MIKSACHDNQANDYDSSINRQAADEKDYIRENYFRIHNRVIELLSIKGSDRILDIGIGTGLLEEKIDKQCKIAGIDISKKMMEKVLEKSLSVELKEGSFLNIPYPDSAFDSIISCFAFHHLDNSEKKLALKEIDRVLRQNGKFILADFMYKNAEAGKELENRFEEERRQDMIEEMKDENFTNIEWFTDLLAGNHYEIECEQMASISWIVKVTKKQPGSLRRCWSS